MPEGCEKRSITFAVFVFFEPQDVAETELAVSTSNIVMEIMAIRAEHKAIPMIGSVLDSS